MKRRSSVPLLSILSLCCVIAAAYDQDACSGNLEFDEDDNTRSETCRYLIHSGCCSSQENHYLKLLRNLVIGLSVAVVGLIMVFIVLVGCCCCCGCLTVDWWPHWCPHS